jgi:predicted HTH domain antitoxin
MATQSGGDGEDRDLDSVIETALADAEDPALAVAVGRYALGEISLGKASEIADVDRWTMAEFLTDHGIEVRMGPATRAELESDVQALRDRE